MVQYGMVWYSIESYSNYSKVMMVQYSIVYYSKVKQRASTCQHLLQNPAESWQNPGRILPLGGDLGPLSANIIDKTTTNNDNDTHNIVTTTTTTTITTATTTTTTTTTTITTTIITTTTTNNTNNTNITNNTNNTNNTTHTNKCAPFHVSHARMRPISQAEV